jgi:hypothetical protein
LEQELKMTEKNAAYRISILSLIFIFGLVLSACGGVSSDPVPQDPLAADPQENMGHQDLPGADLAAAAGDESAMDPDSVSIDSGHVDYVPEADVQESPATLPVSVVIGILIGLVLVVGLGAWLVMRNKSAA